MDIIKVREELRKGKSIYDLNLRVVYYARVSTDKDDQLNSLENQRKYFEDMIKENKNWIFCGGYIDEGISGTGVRNRKEFLRMIDNASNIDLILTKEISRFSRNTVDSIKYTEYLLKNGVCVYFIADNLNTIQEDSEFRLTIMSSLAQDEVRKLSERVKFGINRMIKDRKLIGGNLTGYYKKDGKYEINPKEAFIIKYLFDSYVSGVNLREISLSLYDMGYNNKYNKPYSQTTLAKFLTNPRYKGFYTARLTEVESYKTHKKKKVPIDRQIIEKDDRIPAIISEELWDKVNDLYRRKKKVSPHILNSSLRTRYSCLIHCSCGNIFVRCGGSNRKNNPIWVCKSYKSNGKDKCLSSLVKESLLDEIFINIFKNFIDRDIGINILNDYKKINTFNNIDERLNLIYKQKDKLLDLSLNGYISDIDFKNKNDKFDEEISLLKSKVKSNNSSIDIKLLKKALDDKLNVKNSLDHLIKLLIKKIEIEKIDDDRKHIRIYIYFNFKKEMVVRELYLKYSKVNLNRV